MNPQRTYYRLRRRTQKLQRAQWNAIVELLSRNGGCVSYTPEDDPEEAGMDDFPVKMLFYGKHENPCIALTDVSLDEDGKVRVNGINDKIEIPEKNYSIDPEHYAGILDFIAIVQGYREYSPATPYFKRVKLCIEKSVRIIKQKVFYFLGADPLSRAYRRVRGCTDYGRAVAVIRKSGLILSGYGDYEKTKDKSSAMGYAYYTVDGARENPCGITLVYTFRQIGHDSYVADKIVSIECNR